MADAWNAPADGDGGAPFKPFDREALHATLADALKGAEAVDGASVAESGQLHPEQVPPPSGHGDRSVGEGAAPAVAPAAKPFGRPAPPVRPGPLPGSGVAAPAPPVRSAPNLLGAGVGGSISAMAAGGLGVSALRPPGSLQSPFGGSGGLAAPGLAGLGSPGEAAGEPPATIALRRPAKPEVTEASPEPEAAAAAASQPRPAPPIPGWSPTEDDILPARHVARRRGFRFGR